MAMAFLEYINKLIQEHFEKYCINCDSESIEILLKQFKFLATHNNGEYFEIVADKGNLSLIKMFVEYGADINVDRGYILYTCSYHGYNDCVEYLLRKGANIDLIKNTLGYSNALDIKNRLNI